MENVFKKYGERRYNANEVIWFRKTKEAFGGLSNMCAGYPLLINGHKIRSSEAIYQACRFPDLPEVQRMIINEKSPMSAKMKSKPYRKYTRKDWDEVRIPIMRWSLEIKLAQNFIKFGQLLEETYPKLIVEDSRKDRFWGAVREKEEPNIQIGVNALGRLLMQLREKYMLGKNRYDLLYVKPLNLDNFKLFGEAIKPVDERLVFLNQLLNDWNFSKEYHVTKKNNTVQNNLFDADFTKESNNLQVNFVKESKASHVVIKNGKSIKNGNNSIEKRIVLLLKQGKSMSSKEIIKEVQSDWTSRKMTSFLKKMNNITEIKSKPLKFKIELEPTLFK